MARKNVFSGAKADLHDDEEKAPLSADSARDLASLTAPLKKSFIPNNAVGALQSSLMNMRMASIQDIDPDKIEDSGLKDRLVYDDADIEALKDSIERHGQQVPILVRPHPTRPDHYQIVYGRRRLRALKLLGKPLKAMVRSMEDTELVLAQGQENSVRLNPSFIEKALFVKELERAGYPQETACDALSVDASMYYRLLRVANEVPLAVIEAIGPAHEVGRRPWLKLMQAIRDQGRDAVAFMKQTFPQGLPKDQSSDKRFELFSEAFLKEAPSALHKPDAAARKASGRSLTAGNGTPLADLSRSPTHLTLRIPAKENPGFADWAQQNLEIALRKLHEEWLKAESDT